MNNPLQDLIVDIENPLFKFSTFWQRFFASLIDGLVLSPFILVDIFNKTTWKSLPILIILSIITLLYKPFFEARYGATIGKMALKLTVVNYQYQKADVKNIILRNIFDIVSRVLVGLTTVITFYREGFDDVKTLGEYSKFSTAEAGAIWITLGMSAIVFIDAIVLIVDSRRQALHDKIGQTLVIQKKENP